MIPVETGTSPCAEQLLLKSICIIAKISTSNQLTAYKHFMTLTLKTEVRAQRHRDPVMAEVLYQETNAASFFASSFMSLEPVLTQRVVVGPVAPGVVSVELIVTRLSFLSTG